MKKATFSLLVCLLFTFLSACTTEKDTTAKLYPELLPDGENEYSVIVADEEEEGSITIEMLREQGIQHVSSISNHPSLETLNNHYPQLEVEEMPVYLVFDPEGLELKTNSYEDFIEFLQNQQE